MNTILALFGCVFLTLVVCRLLGAIYRAISNGFHNAKMRRMNKWWNALSREEQRDLIHDLDDYRKRKHDYKEIFNPTGESNGDVNPFFGTAEREPAEYTSILYGDDTE